MEDDAATGPERVRTVKIGEIFVDLLPHMRDIVEIRVFQAERRPTRKPAAFDRSKDLESGSGRPAAVMKRVSRWVGRQRPDFNRGRAHSGEPAA